VVIMCRLLRNPPGERCGVLEGRHVLLVKHRLQTGSPQTRAANTV
jgi:hypothetical protein